MAINAVRQPPAAGRATILRALGDLSPSESRLGGGRVDISAPLGLYRLGLDQLDDTLDLGQAEFVGWRYLLDGGGQRLSTVDVAQLGPEKVRFAGLARNEQADFLLEAAHLAEEVAANLPEDCEARILIVPALYVSAVWLTAQPPVFIPFLDASRPVHTVDQIAVRPDFLADLLQRAQMRKDRGSEALSAFPSP